MVPRKKTTKIEKIKQKKEKEMDLTNIVT